MNDLPDQLIIDTPEQVSIRFPLAGIGSRFLAILIDTLLQAAGYVALVLIFILIISASPKSGATASSRTPAKNGSSPGSSSSTS